MDAPEPINSLVYTRVNTHHVTRYSGAAAGRGDWQPLDQPGTTTTARHYPHNPRFHWFWCRQQEAAEPQLRIEGEDSRYPSTVSARARRRTSCGTIVELADQT